MRSQLYRHIAYSTTIAKYDHMVPYHLVNIGSGTGLPPCLAPNHFCQLNPDEQTSGQFWIKFNLFHWRKSIWRCRLRNNSYIFPGNNLFSRDRIILTSESVACTVAIGVPSAVSTGKLSEYSAWSNTGKFSSVVTVMVAVAVEVLGGTPWSLARTVSCGTKSQGRSVIIIKFHSCINTNFIKVKLYPHWYTAITKCLITIVDVLLKALSHILHWCTSPCTHCCYIDSLV